MLHALVLIVFFTVLPILLGLVTAALVAGPAVAPACAPVARVVLFLPQVIPLAGAAIAWSWMYSTGRRDQPAPARWSASTRWPGRGWPTSAPPCRPSA